MTEARSWLSYVALTVLAPPLACLTLCRLQVPPIHGWMMRHDCPFGMTGMSRPLPLPRPAGMSGSMRPERNAGLGSFDPVDRMRENARR